MEKTVVIEGQEVKLKTHGAIPFLYKKHFGKDLFSEMQKMTTENINIELFNEFLWVTAKAADNNLPTYEEWTASFEGYPVVDCIEEVQELFISMMATGKKFQEVMRKTGMKIGI